MIVDKTERPFDSAGPPRTSGGRATYDQRLSHILDAAARLIARVGYRDASMRQVARDAGVSLAGLYHYFDNKEEMLYLIQSRTFTALLASLREKLHGVSDPVQQLAAMIRNHVEYFAANIAGLKVCSHELDSLTGDAFEQTRAIRRQYYREVRAIIDRLLDAGGVNGAIDRHVATMYLFGALNWLYRWYIPGRGRPVSAIARQITAQFLRGLPGAARREPSDVAAGRGQRRPPEAGVGTHRRAARHS